VPNTYTLIASNTLSSSAASVTFSSIPSTYTDLVLRYAARSDTSTTSLNITLNSDTATNYSSTYVYGDGTNAVSGRDTSVANINEAVKSNSSGSTANTFTNDEIYIPSYQASQNKPLSSFAAFETNSATNTYVGVGAHLWRNTAAVTSIQLALAGGANFVSGSSFFLYGIKSS